MQTRTFRALAAPIAVAILFVVPRPSDSAGGSRTAASSSAAARSAPAGAPHAAASPATAGAAGVPGSPPAGFYRYPSVAGGNIVFASEGDLWKVPVSGGVAMRLTAYEGEEKFPQLSPDGRYVAFTAQYDGNDDVYVTATSGGEPVRLTYHPLADQVIGWAPDGRILFRSRREIGRASCRERV